MPKKVGVDVGGTHIRAGIIEGNKVTNYIKEKTPKTKGEILNKLNEMITLSLKKGGKDIKSIGIAYPGILKNGFVVKTPNLPIQNFDLKKFLQKKFNKKVIVENDSKCVALSEIKYGVKKKNFIIVTLGTGIGGGIIIDGKLYYGKGNAGEIGHIIIEGKKDLEHFWKNWVKKTKRDYGDFFIKDLVDSKEKRAKEKLGEIYTYLGMGIGSLISIFDPEEVILMGGIREGGKKFTQGIITEAKKYTIIKDFPKIEWSRIDHPGVLGAGLLIKD